MRSLPAGGSGLIDEAGARVRVGFRWVERGHWWPTGVCAREWVCVGMRGYAWRPEQDSNLRPLAPEASALSAELSGQLGQFSRVSYIHAER